jgi:hypothetical protein
LPVGRMLQLAGELARVSGRPIPRLVNLELG